MEDLFKVGVGSVGLTPTEFYNCTIAEVKLAIEGYEDKVKNSFFLTQLATYNGYGKAKGGRKFKPVNPFEAKAAIKQGSLEEKEEVLNYLQQKLG